MKKYIFTESQLKNIIDNQVVEQKGFWAPKPGSATSLLKDIRVNMEGYGGDAKKVKLALQTGKFKVTNANSGVILNDKPYSYEDVRSKNLILTPQTKIELSGSIQMSGMGMPECEIHYDANGDYLEFIPQYQ
jgi:hypothetical protein